MSTGKSPEYDPEYDTDSLKKIVRMGEKHKTMLHNMLQLTFTIASYG
jgi:hypothetical protein